MKLRIKRLDKDLPMPVYAKPGDAGFDLRAADDVVICPGETVMVGTGLAVEIPEGYNGEVRARSGMASKRMLAPINEPGTVDSGYRGEVMVPLHNFAPAIVIKEDDYGEGARLGYNHGGVQHVKRGERIAQMVITPCVKAEFFEVEELDDTERGAGGFGSTGE